MCIKESVAAQSSTTGCYVPQRVVRTETFVIEAKFAAHACRKVLRDVHFVFRPEQQLVGIVYLDLSRCDVIFGDSTACG